MKKLHQKITLIGAYTIVGACILFIVLFHSGWFLKLRGDQYGREYNKERLKQGQPIIEDYFIKKPVQRNKQLSVWSDTTELHVHLDKSYFINEYGNLLSETDYYHPPLDSVWLRAQLGISEHEQLESFTFNRTFYFDKSPVVYDIRFRLKSGPLSTVTIDQDVGDSLFQTLKSLGDL